jgi:hypothetical protein
MNESLDATIENDFFRKYIIPMEGVEYILTCCVLYLYVYTIVVYRCALVPVPYVF